MSNATTPIATRKRKSLGLVSLTEESTNMSGVKKRRVSGAKLSTAKKAIKSTSTTKKKNSVLDEDEVNDLLMDSESIGDQSFISDFDELEQTLSNVKSGRRSQRASISIASIPSTPSILSLDASISNPINSKLVSTPQRIKKPLVNPIEIPSSHALQSSSSTVGPINNRRTPGRRKSATGTADVPPARINEEIAVDVSNAVPAHVNAAPISDSDALERINDTTISTSNTTSHSTSLVSTILILLLALGGLLRYAFMRTNIIVSNPIDYLSTKHYVYAPLMDMNTWKGEIIAENELNEAKMQKDKVNASVTELIDGINSLHVEFDEIMNNYSILIPSPQNIPTSIGLDKDDTIDLFLQDHKNIDQNFNEIAEEKIKAIESAQAQVSELGEDILKMEEDFHRIVESHGDVAEVLASSPVQDETLEEDNSRISVDLAEITTKVEELLKQIDSFDETDVDVVTDPADGKEDATLEELETLNKVLDDLLVAVEESVAVSVDDSTSDESKDKIMEDIADIVAALETNADIVEEAISLVESSQLPNEEDSETEDAIRQHVRTLLEDAKSSDSDGNQGEFPPIEKIGAIMGFSFPKGGKFKKPDLAHKSQHIAIGSDIAVSPTGAKILNYHTSKCVGASKFNIPIPFLPKCKKDSSVMISYKPITPGDCYQIAGNTGRVTINFFQPAVIKAIGISHVIDLNNDHDSSFGESSAPNMFQVFGWTKEPSRSAARSFALGGFNFDPRSPQMGSHVSTVLRDFGTEVSQVFDIVQSESDSSSIVPAKAITLQFFSNHGYENITSIYRIKVFGNFVDEKVLQN